MSDDSRLLRLRRLVDELESEDAFERRDAIETLALLTQQRLGFAWRAEDDDRARSVRRWRKWLRKEQERRKSLEVQATLQILASGQGDPSTLKSLLEGLPDDQKKQLLAHVLTQAVSQGLQASQLVGGGSHPPCHRCTKRPATVKITHPAGGGLWVQEELCAVCSQKL